MRVIEFAEAARRRRNAAQEEWHLDPDEIGPFLAHQIWASKLTYSAIAREAGVSPSTVGHLASGETHSPQYRTVWRVMGALGFDATWR